MIATECKPLNWMISKASEYVKDEVHTTHRFCGKVRYSMIQEVNAWMKAQGAHYDDGRTRSGYSLKIEETIDVETKWYRFVSIRVMSGNTYSNTNTVEVMLTVYDCPLTDEDIAEMMANEKVQKV